MEVAEIAAKLESRAAGQVFTIEMSRPAKMRAGCPHTITKRTILQGQLCDYSSRKPVAAAIAAGERALPELPGHIAESFAVGVVRFWRGKNGRTYLPVPLFGRNVKSEFTLNGVPTHKADLKPFLLAAEFGTHDTQEGNVPFIAVGTDNIISIR